MSEHLCHAEGCMIEVPPALLMCSDHWKMVPKRVQTRVWNEYELGQEVTKTPTYAYLVAAHDAIEAVATKEGRRTPPETQGRLDV